MPKISVIIPVYNVEEYLAECLDSVLSQTLNDIEIICINDGSTDNSVQILNKYAEKDLRIKVSHRENRGVGYTRNEGIRKAKGEFVAFLDPDDLYPDSNVLQIMYKNAIEQNVKICGGSMLYYVSKQVVNLTKIFFEKNELINYLDYQYDYAFYRFIYNREFLLNNHIYFPNYRRFQDPPFFTKAMFCAKIFYAIKQGTYLYRINHRQIDWTFEKQLGLLNGIRDNFIFAKKYKLKELYKLTSQRLYEHRHVFYTQNFYLRVCIYLLFFSVCFDKFSMTILKRIIIKYFYQKRFKQLLKKYLKTKQICLWGASLFLEEFLNKHKINNPNIIGIIDTNPEKQGKIIGNYKVYSPAQIKELNPKYILLTIKNNNEQRYIDVQNFIAENKIDAVLLPNVFEGELIYD